MKEKANNSAEPTNTNMLVNDKLVNYCSLGPFKYMHLTEPPREKENLLSAEFAQRKLIINSDTDLKLMTILHFTSLSTLFKAYPFDERMIMKASVQFFFSFLHENISCGYTFVLCIYSTKYLEERQTPSGAVSSGSALFAYVIVLDKLVYEILGHSSYRIYPKYSDTSTLYHICSKI